MHPLTQKIASLQHRLTLRRRLVAACSVAATVLAVALVLGLADYLLRYSDRGLRIIATTALTAAAAWAGYRWWYLPNRHRLVPLTVAQRVEARFPQLGDALASAVEFLGQSEEEPGAGSAQLRRHVITEAENTVDGLNLDDVVDRRPLRRAGAWLGAALVVLAVFLALDPGAVGTALARLAVPFGSAEWPRQHHLEFRQLPARLAAGQTFEVELVDTAGQLPDEVRIEYRTSQAGRQERESEKMTRVGDVMVARRENVERSFSFRAAGGDDDTMPWHTVDVVEPPRLESLELVVHPPAYTGLAAAPAERHLEVLAGSTIEVRGTASEPLRAARILLDGDEAVNADVGLAKEFENRRFQIPLGHWLAAKTGTYRIELTDSDGLAGVVGQWKLRVDPDAPPTIAWQSPSDDIYVTPIAGVPLALTVKDNLAIQNVDLLIETPTPKNDGLVASATSANTDAKPAAPEPNRIPLYRGPEKPPAPTHTKTSSGDSRVVEHELDVAAMKVPVGSQIVLHGEAADYRPGVGRTVAPRRITIITPDELEARLADRQAQIVRQLERALATERTTREDSRRLEIQQREAGSLKDGDRNALQSVDLNQRRVGRMLNDPAEGVVALIDTLLAELEMNRLNATETRATMRELTTTLNRLAAGPLPTAERELTAARKTAEAGVNGASAELLSRSLTAAGAAQEEVVRDLEQLLGELAGWADFRRFARQLAELRQDQIAHERTSRSEIGLETLPLDVRELGRAQRANLTKAAAGQDALARRYEKIEQGMDALAKELESKDAAASATLTDAVALARRLTIGTNMHETSRDLGENRVGVALARETQIAADIQQVLDLLRDERGKRGKDLVDQLKKAQEQLAKLQQDLARLREQIQQAEKQGAAASPQALAALKQQQDELRKQIDGLTRELDRLQADAASRSTKSAANRLNNKQGGNQNQADNKPSSSSEVQQSEKDLEEAARQLAQRVQEAELDLALEFVRRFQAELQEMVTRQKSVIDDTVALDKSRSPRDRLTPAQLRKLSELTTAERELAGLATEHGEVLAGLGAVRISLEEAARRLSAAAELLNRQHTGHPAQQAEQRALTRLEGMLEAFAQTAKEAGQKPPAGAGNQGQDGQQRRPTFELLEVKMLRMLQVDLNERTRSFQEKLAAHPGGRPADARNQAELTREAQELAAEQRRLAGLVQEMLSRNNKQEEE